VARRSGRRGHPRKPRGRGRTRTQEGAASAAAVAESPTAAADAAAASRARRRSSSRGSGAGGRLAEQAALGERPQAPWHPLPLSELLILVGIVGVIVGASRGESGLPVIAVGIGAIAIGTLDFSIREHLSGYRPHTTLLAAIPTAVLHGALALALVALGASSTLYVVAPLVVDVPVFAVLFKLLRARFRDARRERVFAAGR
jgi:hypothetical protein